MDALFDVYLKVRWLRVERMSGASLMPVGEVTMSVHSDVHKRGQGVISWAPRRRTRRSTALTRHTIPDTIMMRHMNESTAELHDTYTTLSRAMYDIQRRAPDAHLQSRSKTEIVIHDQKAWNVK